MAVQCLPQPLVGNRQQLQRARGDAGLAEQLIHRKAAEVAVRRGLGDDGVARDQRRGDRPQQQRHREVEGPDHRPHAVRAHDAPAALGAAGGAHLRGKAPVRGHLLAVVVDQHHALVDLAQRLQQRLADLVRKDRRELVASLGDGGRDSADDPHPLAPIGRRPLPREAPRDGNGSLEVLERGGGEAPHQHAAVPWRVLPHPPIARARDPVDVKGMLLTQPPAQLLERRTERASVQLAGGEGLVSHWRGVRPSASSEAYEA